MENIINKLFDYKQAYTNMNPNTGSWHVIVCNQHTHQDWVFKEDSWSCRRFNATMPSLQNNKGML
jgi:hypothetical protein